MKRIIITLVAVMLLVGGSAQAQQSDITTLNPTFHVEDTFGTATQAEWQISYPPDTAWHELGSIAFVDGVSDGRLLLDPAHGRNYTAVCRYRLVEATGPLAWCGDTLAITVNIPGCGSNVTIGN